MSKLTASGSQRVEEKSSSMLSLQQELEALREERARERDIAERRQRQDQEEIRALQERCDILESGGGGGGVRFVYFGGYP